MMKISKDDIRHLASLSSITLSDSEVEDILPDVEKIIDYINQLQEIDTENVEPTYMVNDPKNVWREDEIEQSVSSEKLVGLAQSSSNNSIEVPKVL